MSRVKVFSKNIKRCRFFQAEQALPIRKYRNFLVCSSLFILIAISGYVFQIIARNYGRIFPGFTSQEQLTELSYDLPSIFNVQAYLEFTNISLESTIHKSFEKQYPHSIGAKFEKDGRAFCGRHKTPFIPALRYAFNAYGEVGGHDPDIKLANAISTLTVQISPGRESNPVFLTEVSLLSMNFSDVLLVPSISADLSARKAVYSLSSRIKKLPCKVHIRNSYTQSADANSYLLSIAANLMIHGGAHGAFAALSNTVGNVYASSELSDYLAKNEFKWMIPNGVKPLVTLNTSQSALSERFQAMGPVRPTCCDFQKFGKGDEQKVVCSNARNFAKPKCWVLSIGCNNKWNFELDVYMRTNCTIHVFDCTINIIVPQKIKDRVFAHKLCVGPPDKGQMFLPLEELIRIASNESGFPISVAPTIAKIDVEGWEIPSLRPFISNKDIFFLFPPQILMEIHFTASIMFNGISTRNIRTHYQNPSLIIREFFANLSEAGYDLVHRADNPYCLKCSEVTLLHSLFAPSTQI